MPCWRRRRSCSAKTDEGVCPTLAPVSDAVIPAAAAATSPAFLEVGGAGGEMWSSTHPFLAGTAVFVDPVAGGLRARRTACDLGAGLAGVAVLFCHDGEELPDVPLMPLLAAGGDGDGGAGSYGLPAGLRLCPASA